MKIFAKNIVFIFLAVIGFFSCNESITENKVENLAPETHLVLFPDSTISQQKSRLEVNWWGDDPDGLVEGFYFKWEGLNKNWHFTSRNDSIFSLPIGTVDTNYTFKIFAVDNGGNNKYDENIVRNGIDLGSEPFVDKNNNGKYDKGEPYTDIGKADPTPAEQKFPIKNSAPTISWNELSQLPLTSFPVMTVGWNANDLDGNESIVKIYIALNDTNKALVLPGSIRLVTLKIDNLNDTNPAMNVFINGSPNNKFDKKLTDLRLNNNNIIYVQAEDISGAKSGFIRLPDSSRSWYIKKPKGKLLIVDDYKSGNDVTDFYNNVFDNIHNGELKDRYNIINLETTQLPYQNITLLETIKLFDDIFWYSDDSPSLDIINTITKEYLQSGGKAAFSMTFRDSSSTFPFSLSSLQGFVPVDSLGQEKPLSFLFPGAKVEPVNGNSEFPVLKTSSTIGFVRTYFPNTISSSGIYNLNSSQLKGGIALLNNTKNLFFIGLPLHQCDADNNVKDLLEKVFYQEFNFTQ